MLCPVARDVSDDRARAVRPILTWLLFMSLFFAVGYLVVAIAGRGSGLTWIFAISWTLLATGAAYKWHQTRTVRKDQTHRP